MKDFRDDERGRTENGGANPGILERRGGRRLWLERPFVEQALVRVIECRERGGIFELRTEETIFFPGGGGQGADHGTMGGGRLLSVKEEDGPCFVHRLASRPKTDGDWIEQRLDMARRLELSRNHSAQHVLSAVAYREFTRQTLSVHFGDEACTVELDGPPPGEDEIERIERRCNETMRSATALRCYHVDASTFTSPLLRKALPAGEDFPRIVEVAGYDLVPCCGTHVETAAMAAPLLVIGTERVRGHGRLAFVCADKALAWAREAGRVLYELGALLDCPAADLASRCRALAGKREELAAELDRTKRELFLLRLERLAPLARSERMRLLHLAEEGSDGGKIAQWTRRFLRGKERTVVLVSRSDGDKTGILFTRTPDLDFSCRDLLPPLLRKLGGKGGGGEDLAQGFVPGEAVESLLEYLVDELI